MSNPDTEKLEALRTGIDFANAGKIGPAKIWLIQSMPNPAAALILAQLYARSRSVRASRRALWYLGLAIHQVDELDAIGRQEVAALAANLMKRNLEPQGPTTPSAVLIEYQRHRSLYKS